MSTTPTVHPGRHHVEHAIDVGAAPEELFRLIEDVERWPQLFTPTVHVTILDRSGTSERLRMWATANGEARTWTSVREVDAANLRITFHQDLPVPPVAAMGGQWRVEPLTAGRCRVVLTHDYAAVGDDPQVLEWLASAVEHNSTSELDALAAAAEQGARRAELTLSFDDTVTIDADASEIYRFLAAAGRWPDLLPHVARVDLSEDDHGVQVLEMDTRAPDGQIHTTRSVRVCFPDERIVYKQLLTPRMLAAHIGSWHLEPARAGSGVDVTARHTVVLLEDVIPEVLGSGASVAAAAAFVRNAVGGNSRATLERARAHVTGRADG